MPEEVLLVAMTAILSGAVVLAVIVRSITGLIRGRQQQRRQEGASLRTSELQALMQAAAEEASLPILEQLDVLHDRLDRLERKTLAQPSVDRNRLETEGPVLEKTVGRVISERPAS